jgi:hypothetical protein
MKKPNSIVMQTHCQTLHMIIILKKSGKSSVYAKLDPFIGMTCCCQDHKICLSALKCDLFLTSVIWCGRKINTEGIGFDIPNTVGDLQQYLCRLNWIRLVWSWSCIPYCNKEIDPLRECMQEIISKVRSNRIKRRFFQIENYHISRSGIQM